MLLISNLLQGNIDLRMNKVEFVEWLENVLQERKMSRADLARSSGISAPQITRILNGEQTPRVDSINSIARAIEKTPEEVFRRAAGISNVENGAIEKEAAHLVNLLPDDMKQTAVRYLRYLVAESEAERK